MARIGTSNVFSNSLELERRLRQLGARPDMLESAFERLEKFQTRFVDETYMLMAESQIDMPAIAAALAETTRTPRTEIVCLSCEQLEHATREEQYRLYELSRLWPTRRLLETEAYMKFANGTEAGDRRRRRMHEVIKGALGTRRLCIALDNSFGNSFASVLKHDIVCFWTMYFKSYVPAANGLFDQKRIDASGAVVDALSQVVPMFYLGDSPTSWTALTA